MNTSQKKEAAEIFNREKMNVSNYNVHLYKLKELVENKDILKVIIESMFIITMADDNFHYAQEKMILEAVTIFALTEIEYKEIKEMYVEDLDEYYKTLGCNRQATNEEIKKAYRQLMMKYHPDKYASKDLPEEVNNMINEKCKEVQDAYSKIMNHKQKAVDKQHKQKDYSSCSNSDNDTNKITWIQCDYVHTYDEGVIIAIINKKYKLINKLGEDITPMKYDFALTCREGYIRVKLNNKFGYIDKLGKEMIPFKYDEASWFEDGLANVKLNDKYGVIDKTGKVVIPIKYKKIEDFYEGLCRIKDDNCWIFIDKAGKEVAKFQYEFVGLFSEGLARVLIDGRYVYIDIEGKEIISTHYDFVGDFIGGYAEVSLNGKEGIIDKTGREVVPLIYDDIFLDDVKEGLFEVSIDKKYGFIDMLGNEIVEIKYDYSSGYEGGLSAVKLNGKYGCINKKGEMIVPIKYDNIIIDKHNINHIIVKVDSKWGILNI